MDYKNLISRILISLIFLIVYLLISFLDYFYLLYLIVLIYIFIIIEVLLYFKNLKFFIVSYLLISSISLLNINFVNFDYKSFNLFVLTIISFDIFSYIFGKLYGKRKILYKISPNKTFEGFLGGFACSFLINLVYAFIYEINIDLQFLILTFLIILSAFFGDIIESVFKRINNIKNSSNFLLGHGGFFDRFDSFILAIVMYSFLYKII